MLTVDDRNVNDTPLDNGCPPLWWGAVVRTYLFMRAQRALKIFLAFSNNSDHSIASKSGLLHP